MSRLHSDLQELSRRTQPIDKLLSDQPFGRRERWVEVVKPATDWLDQQALALERKPLSRDAGLALLRDIVAVADSEYWDYDSARQLVWATNVLRRELAGDSSSPAVRDVIATVAADLADVEKLFALNLLDGRKAEQEIPGSTKTREVTEVDLTKTLPPIADYDATVFREKFRKVSSKLTAK